eukprot:11111566-Alexandrium_andersonii.AAC.1
MCIRDSFLSAVSCLGCGGSASALRTASRDPLGRSPTNGSFVGQFSAAMQQLRLFASMGRRPCSRVE